MRARLITLLSAALCAWWNPSGGGLRPAWKMLSVGLIWCGLGWVWCGIDGGFLPVWGPTHAWGQTGSQTVNPFLPGYGQPGTGLGDASLPALGSPPAQIAPPSMGWPPVAGGQPVSPTAIQPYSQPAPYSQFAPPAGTGWPATPGPAAPGAWPSGAFQPTTPQVNPLPGGINPAGIPAGGVVGYDPFAPPPQIPPGYPNLPAPWSGYFTNPFVTPTTDSATVFAAPNSGGGWSSGLLNNPNAQGTQTWSAQSWQRFWQASDWQKLWHAFRMRHTYIQGGTIDRVQINDSEIATSLSFPNFFGSQMPLTISPGFIVHNWEGPNSITGNDLPGAAYSAYLSFDHSTTLDQQFGGEFNFTTGVFSDFSTFTQHSMRFMGTGLLWMRLSPTSTFKLGVEYLDRVEIKLLPAGGLFWMPDPQTRLSFYFPRPKFAKRFPNFGNVEVWGYLAGEYGGGSWTIRREAGFSDQVDLNDMRVTAGLEWIGIRGVTGFGEMGYVFERQLIYRSTSPADSVLGSAIMFRGGFAY